MKLRCASCKKVLKAPDDAAGRVVACPACGKKIRVPGAVPHVAAKPSAPTPQPTPPPAAPADGPAPTVPGLPTPPQGVSMGYDPFAPPADAQDDDEPLILNAGGMSRQNRILLSVAVALLVAALLALAVRLKLKNRPEEPMAEGGPGPVRVVGAIDQRLMRHATDRTVYLIPRSVELRDIHRRFCEANEEVRPYWKGILADDPSTLLFEERTRALAITPTLMKLYDELKGFLSDASGRRVRKETIDEDGKFDFGTVDDPGSVYYVVYHIRQETKEDIRNYVWMLPVWIAGDGEAVIVQPIAMPRTVTDAEGIERQTPGEAFLWFETK